MLHEGDEEFRGLFRQSHMSCAEWSSVFTVPGDSIEWSEIPPAQLRDPLGEKALAEYKSTIKKGFHQWNYSEEEFTSLVALYNLMASTEPLPFHWYTLLLLLT